MVRKIFLLLGAVLVLFFAAGCAASTAKSEPAGQQDAAAGVTVKMLDVGQGDALLLRTGEQTILIDSGDVDARDTDARCAGTCRGATVGSNFHF